ncbi:beta strand repeat-containing protein, partial [Chryseobacterium sp.]|uniref:beta strand repeat-containing protein n=1 Tax=Chryseobacterium sp. TaxID=1871047 RepID=UPI0039183CD2
MKIFINYEPPQKGAVLIKAFLSRAVALVLLLTVSFIYAQSPGGVTGARLWYRADAGITQSGGFITQWNNQANPGNYNLVQNGAAGTIPSYNSTSNLINFNPSARFDGSNDRLSVSVPLSEVASGSNPYASSHYIVYRGLSTTSGALYSSAINAPSTWNIAAVTAGQMYITNRSIPTSAVAVNETRLQEFDGASNGATSYLNGSLISSAISAVTVGTSGGSPFFSVGVDPGGSAYSNADIAEVIVFNTAQPANRQRIESYLGLKYGITLGSPASVVNYTASDGTTIFWTGNATYQNNIAGIGRDDDSGLSQKQSQSSNSGIQPIIGNVNITATNLSNPNSLNIDKSFMMWGSDTGNTSFTTAFAFGGLNNRMARIWRVQETGTVGTVKVALKVSDLPGSVTNPTLLVSSDAVFDGADTRQTMILETIGGVPDYTTTLDLASGQFFSFAGFVTAPGGVLGSSLWLKADSGTSTVTNGSSVSQWNDQSPNLNNFVQSTVSSQPLFATNNTDNLNYNPVVKIGGAYRLNSSLNLSARDIISVSYPVGGDGIGGVTTTITCNSGYINRLELAGTTSYSGGNTANSYIQATSPSFVVSGKPVISHTALTGTAGTGKWYMNGLSLATSDLNNTPVPFNRLISIGGYVCNNSASQNLPEVIAYNTNLTISERLRINSYLAIKYGITLDQSTAQNYLASDGSTIFWDATANSTYKNNIAGIGRDDASALSQKQSQSVNNGIQPVIGNGNIFDTNANNTNTFGTDKSFLVWGSDTGSTNFATAFAFGGLNNRMARIWKVQETGTVGTVKVALEVNDVPGSVTNPTLLLSTDAVFDGTDTRQAMVLETIGGVQYYTTTVDLTSGQFFSFAGLVTAPGGVVSNLNLWLKADLGTSTTADNTAISQWDDLSGVGNNATQSTTANRPSFQNNSGNNINFNPVVNFDGTNDYFQLSNTLQPLGASQRTLVIPFSSSGFSVPISWGSNGANTLYTIRVNPIALDYGNGNVQSSGSGTSTNLNLMSAIYNGSAHTLYQLGKALATNNISLNTSATLAALGADVWTGTYSNFVSGKIPEAIMYSRGLSASELLRVHSYIAIKYGITLDQSTAQNYLAGDGTTIFWNATANTGYNNNIAGIGRDDASALSQKQSQSVNSGIQPVIGNGNIFDTNANNTNSFGADKTFMMWGSDTGSASFATPFAFGSSNFRMTRIWKVQETGTVGTVKVALPVSQLSVSIAQPVLLRSTDAIFDGTDTSLPMNLETIGGVQYYTATIDFASGQFFTFAAFVTAPGGVISGLNLWLKANAGFSSNQWLDQSGSGFIYQQNTAANQPAATGIMNFNTAIRFDGTNDSMSLTSVTGLMNGSIDSNYTQIAALNSNSASATGISDIDSSCGANGDLIWQSDGTIYIDRAPCGTGQPGFGGSTIVPNVSYLNTLTYASPSGQIFTYRNNLQNGTGIQTGVVTTINSAMLGFGSIGSYYNGNIGEYIVYNNTISALERLKIDSYLAIKYGITLDQSTKLNFNNGDFSNNFNFWSSTGNVLVSSGVPSFNSGDSSPNGVISQQISTVNGQSYNFTGDVFRGGGGSGTVRLRLDIIDNVTNSVIATQNLTPASTIPTAFSQSFNGNGNIFTIKFTDISLATTNVDIGVDNLQLSPNASTTGTNYVNSQGSIVWNAAANASYNKNIAGIGRDDASALVQKQSQSANTGNQLIMGLVSVAATNTANTGSFAADKQFLVWGDDDQSGSSAFTGIPGYNSRLNRVWKVQNTNSLNQSVQVLIPLALVPATSSLLAGTDATFAGSYQVYNPTGTVTVNSVSYRAFTLPAVMVNQASFYMTFAFYEQSPGGVRSEALWLRGDAGLAGVTSWLDQSGNNRNLRWDITNCQGHTSRGQMVLGKTLNFNSVASFSDADWTWGFTQTDISRTTTPNADVAIVYKAVSPSVQDVWSTDLGGALDERSLTTTQVGNDNTGIAYSGGNSGFATINVASFKNTTANGSNVLINGNNIRNFTGSTKYVGCPQITIGDVWGAQNPFKGLIGEFVVYRSNITAIERIQLNSYLALKYGITLGRNNNGNATSGEVVSGAVLEGDYLASDGITRTWNSDAVYQNNIVGLGRDDISAFHQRITTSQSASADIITLSTDANFTNNNQSGGSGHTDIANDKSFFITGNNNAATSYTLKSGLSNGMNALMKRVWKTQNTGTSFDVYIKSSNAKASYLVYSADATFSSGVTYVLLTAGATPGIQIPNGNYFTFAAFLEAPGGVFDESLWLKADAGTSSTTNGTGLSQWDDQSDVGNNATQSNAGNRPVYSNLASSMMNYNPVVSFNGSNYLALKRQLLPIGTTGRTEFAVYAANSGYLLSYGANANSASYYGLVGRPLGLDSGQSNFQSGGGTSDSNPLMISHLFAGSGGASAFYRFGRAFNSANRNLNTSSSGIAAVGANVWNGGYNTLFNGRMPELIVYPKALNGTQRSQVDSYLAIKYGLTLVQTTPQNYIASDGVTVVWTA